MCGIIGIISRTDVVPELLDGLERLEYRGYDSAGIAVTTGGGISVRRCVGRLSALRSKIAAEPVSGCMGIAHTRWATHGGPSAANAHPHRAGSVTVVHNGIIENFAELRANLEATGRVFSSETDTEVIPHLIDRGLAAGISPLAALRDVVGKLRGAYALAVLVDNVPGQIFVARQGSPLAIGYGETREDGTLDMYVGSDAIALAPLTTRISYLEDGDVAIVASVGALIFDSLGRDVERPVIEVGRDAGDATRGDFPHYMLKEIHQQPQVLAKICATWGRTDGSSPFRRIAFTVAPQSFDRIVLVACGTSYHAAMVAKYWLETWACMPAEVDIASEYRYRDKVFSGRELVVFISQSGETADTLAALRQVAGRVAMRLAVVNIATSSMAREADDVLEIHAGPEIGVASTKAYTAQLLVLAEFALSLGLERGSLQPDQFNFLKQELCSVPHLVTETLSLEPAIAAHARKVAAKDEALFVGRGVCYPAALEGALKLKEVAYINTDGYAAGELKHGPIALIEDRYPAIVLAPSGSLYEKTMSNCSEIEARGGWVLLLTDVIDTHRQQIRLPRTIEMLSCFTTAVALQLLAYHAAVILGCDVDKPRNLAKSVTVE